MQILVCAHLIILLPPLGLLSTAQDLLLNQTGILKVLLLSVEKITGSVTMLQPLKNGNVPTAELQMDTQRVPLTAVLRPASGGHSPAPTAPPHPAASWLHEYHSAQAGSSGY